MSFHFAKVVITWGRQELEKSHFSKILEASYPHLKPIFSVLDSIAPTPSSVGYELTSAKYVGFSPLANLTSSHQASCIDFWGK